MADDENIIEQWELGDEGHTPVPLTGIEQLKESKLDRMLGAVAREYQEGPLSPSEFKEKEVKHLEDVSKGAMQLGLETAGIINRLFPRDDPSGESSDYYGWSIGDTAEWKDLLPNFIKEGMMETGYEGGITIPLSEINNNPDVAEHMFQLGMIDTQNILNELQDRTGLDLSEALADPGRSGGILRKILKEDPTVSEENRAVIADLLAEKKNNPFYIHLDAGGNPTLNPEEAESITFNYMPQVDEGIFGKDMTLDPQFTSSGDMSLPGLGVWGMRDGNLRQVAASTLRPLDEMNMYNIPGAEWAKENITDKVAWQGPAMHPPEGTGIGYQLPMFYGLGRGIGLPAIKAAYKYPRTATGVGIPSALFAKKAFGGGEE